MTDLKFCKCIQNVSRNYSYIFGNKYYFEQVEHGYAVYTVLEKNILDFFDEKEFNDYFINLNKHYVVEVNIQTQVYVEAESKDDAESKADMICDRISLDSTEYYDSIDYDGHEIISVSLHD